MFNRFCMTQNIRALLSSTSDDIPTTIKQLQPAFEKCFGPDYRGSLHSDNMAMEFLSKAVDPEPNNNHRNNPLPKNSQRLPSNYRRLLQEWIDSNIVGETHTRAPAKATALENINWMGSIFKVKDCSHRDSQVVFKIGSYGWGAGQIEAIFSPLSPPDAKQLPRFFVIVKVYEDLPIEFARMDIYRRFHLAGGMIFKDTFETTELLLPWSDIISHFAGTKDILKSITIPHIHVLPLNKVCEFCSIRGTD